MLCYAECENSDSRVRGRRVFTRRRRRSSRGPTRIKVILLWDTGERKSAHLERHDWNVRRVRVELLLRVLLIVTLLPQTPGALHATGDVLPPPGAAEEERPVRSALLQRRLRAAPLAGPRQGQEPDGDGDGYRDLRLRACGKSGGGLRAVYRDK